MRMKDNKTAFNYKKDIDATSYISLLGLDPQPLTTTPIIRSAVRTDVQTGGIHGLTYRVKKNRKAGHSLKIDHWVMHPDGVVKSARVAHLKSVLTSKGKYKLSNANLFNKKITFQNEKHFFQFLNQLKDILREIRHHHLPSLKTLLDLQKSFLPDREHYKEAMDATGEPLFFEGGPIASSAIISNKAALQKPPIFLVPKHILPALIGFHSDMPTDNNRVIQKIASGNEEDTLRPVFSKAEIKKLDEGGVHITVESWKKKISSDNTSHSEKPAKWFDLKFVPDSDNPEMMKLSRAVCCGKVLKNTDLKNIVRLCRATATAVHQIRTKETIPSLQKLLQDNGMHDVVNRSPSNQNSKIDENGRMTFSVLGGNNIQDIKFNESRIGANGYLYAYRKKDQKTPDAILVDAGILFLDREKHGHDGAFINPEGILPHRDPGHVQPAVNIKALLCTHSHEDHVGAIPHLVKSGYIVPTIVCSGITQAFIREKLKSLEIPQDQWPPFKNIEAYQKMKIGPFRLRALPMSHSSPSLAFRIGTQAGSVLHSGDWKLDPTIKVGYPTDMNAIKRLRVDAMVSDSTSVFREGEMVTEQQVEHNFVDFFNEDPDRRAIVSMLGSNLNRLVTLARACATANKKLVIVGHSLDVSRRILNTVGFIDPETGEHTTFKKYGKKLGVEILTGTSKAGRELLHSGSPEAVIAATGTHNEKLSAIDKMLGWVHKDIEIWPDQDALIVAQGPIPGSEDLYFEMCRRAKEQGLTIIYPGCPEAKGRIFSPSGHAHKIELARVASESPAKYIIPVHGDNRQITAHGQLISENGKHPFMVNNQDITQISKNKAPAIIGQRIESWAYFQNQRPDDVYYGNGVNYNIGFGKPILSGAWAAHSNIPDKLIDFKEMKEADYQPQLKRGTVASTSKPVKASAHFSNAWSQNFSKIIFYDTETTDLKYNEIWQFAALTVDKSGEEKQIDIRQKMSNKVLPSPMACLVVNKSPYALRDPTALPAEEFAKNVHEHLYSPQKRRKKTSDPIERTIGIGHNNLNADDPWIGRTLKKRGYVIGKGIPRADTLPMARAAFLYAPGAINVPIENNRHSFRLGSLAMANDLVNNTDNAHEGGFDVQMTRSIFNHLSKKAPDVTHEMMRRTDFRSNQNWLLGSGQGVQNRPLVTYAVNGEHGLKAVMGMLAAVDLKQSHGRKAIMINLNEDPHFFDDMSPEEVCTLLKDKAQNRLHLLSLNRQPIILPEEYGFNVNANNDIDPKILYERQQNVLRDPDRNRRIGQGVDLFLQKRYKNHEPFYTEDVLYHQPKTYYERQALLADQALLKTIDPSKQLPPETILNALGQANHSNTRKILEERLLDIAPELLPEARKIQLEAEQRLALYAPANSPKMTLKQFKKEMREITENSEKWINGEIEKQIIFDDLIKFGEEFEMEFTRKSTDQIHAGVPLHHRLHSLQYRSL